KAPSPKHLPDYLGAFCWTTNHRKNMRGMISAACRAIATSNRADQKDRLCNACRGDWLIGGQAFARGPPMRASDRTPGRRYVRRFAFQDFAFQEMALAISATIASAASRGFFACVTGRP